MYGLILFLHILSATIWTGGHLVLSLVVLPKALKQKSVTELVDFESGYERVGIPALITQVITGLWLAYRLVPEARRWLAFDHPLTRLIGFKLLLLTITVGFALDARLRLIPRLSTEKLTALAWHIIPVTVVSVLFVLVGASFRTGWLW